MTRLSIPYPGFDYHDFYHRRQQQMQVLLTKDISLWYQQMLRSHRVIYDPARASWLIFGYEEVCRVLLDPQTFSSHRDFGQGGKYKSGEGLIAMDPPVHRHLRSLIQTVYTPRLVEEMEPRIISIANRLLDQVALRREMDIVEDLALPLPVLVIADLLGLPDANTHRFAQWMSTAVGSNLVLRQETFAALVSYFEPLIEQRRSKPGSDLISTLLEAEVNRKRLSQRQVINTCALFLLAGHETTASLISNAILCFDASTDSWQELLAHPEQVPSAIEEVLRYRAPAQTVGRVALSDVVVAGAHIKAGDLVQPLLAAANFEEAQFPHANVFDIRRTPNRHLSMGQGIHYCLGAKLGRLVARIALCALLQRFPLLKRKRNVALSLKPSWFTYGMKHLPVTLRDA